MKNNNIARVTYLPAAAFTGATSTYSLLHVTLLDLHSQLPYEGHWGDLQGKNQGISEEVMGIAVCKIKIKETINLVNFFPLLQKIQENKT